MANKLIKFSKKSFLTGVTYSFFFNNLLSYLSSLQFHCFCYYSSVYIFIFLLQKNGLIDVKPSLTVIPYCFVQCLSNL